jgi:hypothetical protein
MAATRIFLPTARSSVSRISAAAWVESPVSTTNHPFGASMAKLCAMPQPRRAYTPSATCSAVFESVTPSRASAVSAVRVVMAPLGPVTVSVVSDWLCHVGSLPAVGAVWAWAEPSERPLSKMPVRKARMFCRFLKHDCCLCLGLYWKSVRSRNRTVRRNNFRC